MHISALCVASGLCPVAFSLPVTLSLLSKADWAAWHLPSGPVDPPSRWAATSNVEVGQTTYPVNRRRVEREGREGSEGQSHKKEDRERGSGMGRCPGALSQGGMALFGYLCKGARATADGAGHLARAGLKSQFTLLPSTKQETVYTTPTAELYTRMRLTVPMCRILQCANFGFLLGPPSPSLESESLSLKQSQRIHSLTKH